MALNLRAGFRERWARSPATPGGRLVYAVGDIHGRADLLRSLMGKISDDASRASPGAQPVLVFVGDYVDRGPGAKDVIDQVIALQLAGRFEVRSLKGNHEEFLLRFLQDAAVGSQLVRVRRPADPGGLRRRRRRRAARLPRNGS